ARIQPIAWTEPSSNAWNLSQMLPLFARRAPSSCNSQSLIRLRQRQPDPIAQYRRTAPANLIMNLASRIPPAEVREDDRFVFETIGECGDVVEVDVPVLRRPLFMPGG